ncbi:MAG: FkbM family methyltransferase [Fimbriimonadales bacterium]
MLKSALKRVLRKIALATPDIKYVRAFPTLVLWKLHNRLHLGGDIVSVEGFRMFLDPADYADGLFWFAPHQYDKLERNFILKTIPRDTQGWFVDLGANIGFISLWLASRFPNAKILAVEAFPRTYEKLVENIQLNQMKNIVPVQVGVLDERGVLPFYYDPVFRDSASLMREVCDKTHQTIQEVVEVEVVPLDELFREYGIEQCRLVKLDIEGVEERVLRRFYECAPATAYPDLVWAEHLHSPHLKEIVEPFGYTQRLRTNMNVVFERVSS